MSPQHFVLTDRQADRARTPRTALPPGAAAGAPDRSTISHRLRSHASASRRRFLAAYSRSFAFAFASARHRSWRTWLPVPSGSPQTSHGRRRIGAARWRFAWRKIAERLRPNASATARYDAPETSTSSTAAASGWVQAVQGRGIPSDYTETKRPASAAGVDVGTHPPNLPPGRHRAAAPPRVVGSFQPLAEHHAAPVTQRPPPPGRRRLPCAQGAAASYSVPPACPQRLPMVTGYSLITPCARAYAHQGLEPVDR